MSHHNFSRYQRPAGRPWLTLLYTLFLLGAGVRLATAAMNDPASVALEAYIDPWPAGQERWQDINRNTYNDWVTGGSPNGRFSYAVQPRATLTYDRQPGGRYFVGRIDATGLKPNFAYQLKLLGKPTFGSRGMGTGQTYIDFERVAHPVAATAVSGDDWANEQLGYVGRWWDDNNQAPGTNLNDNYYLTYYKNPVLTGQPAPQGNAVHSVYGYHFMGSFITDSRGEAHIDFDGRYSYHIDWASWQGGIQDVIHGSFGVQGHLLTSSPLLYYGYGGTAPSPATVTLYYEYEAARANPVVLPQGDYHCRFMLTEESFHAGGGLGGYWKSVLATEDFSLSGQPDDTAANDVVFRIGHAPVALDFALSTTQNTPVAGTLAATDADDDALTYTVVDGPGHGSVAQNGAAITYTPNAGFSGTDSFTYRAGDGIFQSVAGTVSITVVDPPTLGFSAATYNVAENGGTATITVQRQGGLGAACSVQYRTVNREALAGLDYEAAAGTLQFAPGQTTASFGVVVLNDDIFDDFETLQLELLQPLGATIEGPISVVLTISDDDARPVVSVADVSVIEGPGRVVTFTLQTNRASNSPLYVQCATADISATTRVDYMPHVETVAIPAGKKSAQFSVEILDDPLYEGNERFALNLSQPIGCTLARTQAFATIVDDDGRPLLTMKNAAANEGDAGGAPVVARFEVALSRPASLPVTVRYQTLGGSAVAGRDFTATSGTVTFPIGVTRSSVTVAVLGDNLQEGPETFLVQLSAPTNALIPQGMGTATGYILDNDPAPFVAVNNTSTVESGVGGARAVATFTLSLSQVSGLPVTVTCATGNGTAIVGRDYQAVLTKVTFAPGTSIRTVQVPILDDGVSEPAETFYLQLSTPVNARPAPLANRGACRIIDNDAGHNAPRTR